MSGEFAREWILENQAGRPVFNALARSEAQHRIEEVGRRLREMPHSARGRAELHRHPGDDHPAQPLVLAVNPKSTSSSLPSLVHSGVKDDLMAGLSSLIGLPVAWVAKHEKQVADWASSQLQDETFVENLKVDIRVVLKAQPVTDLSVRMESRRYTIWAWVAGYAGTSDRYPEAGIHLGRKAQIFPRWDVELYGESLLYLNDWDLETRLGIRWSPWDRIWLGAERSWPDEATWWRAWFDGPVRSPYVWIRTSDEGEVNFGVGYRLNENLSIELHYDSRDENPSSVRLVGNL